MKKRAFSRIRSLALHAAAGGASGLLVFHPASMIVRWMEASGGDAAGEGFWSVVGGFANILSPAMLPMTLIYIGVGMLVGLGFGYYHLALAEQRRNVGRLERRLGMDLPQLIEKGETDRVEFKTSLRWDDKAGKLNKALETAIVKTIAGFMNHRGGDLLIGVADDGSILGLQSDFESLGHKGSDGFQRSLMNLVRSGLGGDSCALIHCLFYTIVDQVVCRVVVEASQDPVYCREGNIDKYYARAGNTTRELDAREAVRHIARRVMETSTRQNMS